MCVALQYLQRLVAGYSGKFQHREVATLTHYAPHDIAVREPGTGTSRLETAASLVIDFETVPQLPLEDGIHAVRMIFNCCWFDAAKCKDGIECLSNYRWDYNRRLDEFKTRPLPGREPAGRSGE